VILLVRFIIKSVQSYDFLSTIYQNTDVNINAYNLFWQRVDLQQTKLK
jgi:hypothetical protein